MMDRYRILKSKRSIFGDMERRFVICYDIEDKVYTIWNKNYFMYERDKDNLNLEFRKKREAEDFCFKLNLSYFQEISKLRKSNENK